MANPKQEYTCQNCGKSFKQYASWGPNTCCSKACTDAYRRVQLLEHFWDKVEKGPDCWLWLGNLRGAGYGRLGASPRLGAHRVAWELTYGLIPAGMMVCHHCDTRSCVRPDHLFLGTNADNQRDASQKGRLASGKRNGRYTTPTKLKQSDIYEIRRLLSTGLPQKAIAITYNVHQSAISRIATKRRWSALD